MAIIRTVHNKENPYTIVNTTVTKDTRLSWKAKGIWFYAFSRPDDWQFYVADLVKQSTDGKDAVAAGLKELEDAGYLVRERERNDKGQLKESHWTFHELPQEFKEKVPKTENPTLDNPSLENPPLLINESNEVLKETTTSSSFSRCPDKEKALSELPLNQQTIDNMMRFDLDTIKTAVHNTKASSPDEVNGFVFDQAKNKYPKKQTKESLIEKHRTAAMRLFGSREGVTFGEKVKATVTACNNYLEVTYGAHAKTFMYEEATFPVSANDILKKLGWKELFAI